MFPWYYPSFESSGFTFCWPDFDGYIHFNPREIEVLDIDFTTSLSRTLLWYALLWISLAWRTVECQCNAVFTRPKMDERGVL